MQRRRQTNRFIIRRHEGPDEDENMLSRGQIIVIFVMVLVALIGALGLAIDLSYTFTIEARMQKAADAAALAGAVYLPDDPVRAKKAAEDSARQNGFVGSGDVIVDARQDANPEQMDVSITQPVDTFFMRIFGINELVPTRTARAQFNQPVPMGSPIDSFGDPNATDLSGQKLNFWAAVNGPCTDKEQGDPYATKVTTSTQHANCATQAKTNSEHKAATTGDPGSYDYAIKLPSNGALSISLYDPEFCERKGSAGRKSMKFDTGDYSWDDQTNFTTVFSLWDSNGTPYDLTDDIQIGGSASYPGDSKTTPGGSCSSTYVNSVWDNNTVADNGQQNNFKAKGWVTPFSFTASAGTYRLSVQTVSVTGAAANASNQFGIRANFGGAGSAQVYAGLAGTKSAMSIFNNIETGGSNIFLAKIGSQFAGKTMQVSLFDPGEVNGNAYMYFVAPNGTNATFDWRDAGANLGPGGSVHTGATRLQTANSGGGLFNGHWVVVTIKIPSSGYTGGWWKIHYDMGGAAHDRTTWRVEVQDNPVHLVP